MRLCCTSHESHEISRLLALDLTDEAVAFMGLHDVLRDPLSSVIAVVKPKGCEKVFNAMLALLGSVGRRKTFTIPQLACAHAPCALPHRTSCTSIC